MVKNMNLPKSSGGSWLMKEEVSKSWKDDSLLPVPSERMLPPLVGLLGGELEP